MSTYEQVRGYWRRELRRAGEFSALRRAERRILAVGSLDVLAARRLARIARRLRLSRQIATGSAAALSLAVVALLVLGARGLTGNRPSHEALLAIAPAVTAIGSLALLIAVRLRVRHLRDRRLLYEHLTAVREEHRPRPTRTPRPARTPRSTELERETRRQLVAA